MVYSHGINSTLLINLGGNIVFVIVEVIDSPLDYNYQSIVFDSMNSLQLFHLSLGSYAFLIKEKK